MQPSKTDIYLIHMGNIRIDRHCTYFKSQSYHDTTTDELMMAIAEH